MLETSKDLFYLVLTFCVLGFTVFLCWALYYMIRMLKQFNEVMEAAREKIEQVTNVVSFVKGKLFSKGVKTIFDYVTGDKEEKETKKNKTKKRK